MLKNIFSVHPTQVESDILALDIPKYKAKQLLKWLYIHFESSPDAMTDLSKKMRDELVKLYSFSLPEIAETRTSVDRSSKYMLQLADGNFIEMVIIPAAKKNTLCISSQVGCARNCSFCATAKMGLIRNLEIEEIVGQVILASKLVKPNRITNIVFMGMGEPLDNIDNVLSALEILQAEDGISFSPRRTTISTCGVVPAIIKLANSGVRTKLAVSLNSAIESKRTELMPINEIYPLEELKKALIYFRKKTSFKVTFEYIMIPEVNMAWEDINSLKKYVSDLSCKINLIPWNPVSGIAWTAPRNSHIDMFLTNSQVINQTITLRKSRGSDILGACGQLAARQIQKESL